MLTPDRAAGSRMHVLDWLDGGMFIPSVNEMLRPTELFVPQGGKRMAKGWDSPDEAQLGKDCGSLIDDCLNAELLKWWLVKAAGANVPNWDLACEALYDGNRPALVLVEAKAYVREFTNGACGNSAKNEDNRKRIKTAIEEACVGLSQHVPGVNISSDSWYQFSNRVAFAWKLASLRVPTALIYLGLLGDKGISADPLRDHDHWRETVVNSTRQIFERGETLIDMLGPALAPLLRSIAEIPSGIVRLKGSGRTGSQCMWMGLRCGTSPWDVSGRCNARWPRQRCGVRQGDGADRWPGDPQTCTCSK